MFQTAAYNLFEFEYNSQCDISHFSTLLEIIYIGNTDPISIYRILYFFSTTLYDRWTKHHTFKKKKTFFSVVIICFRTSCVRDTRWIYKFFLTSLFKEFGDTIVYFTRSAHGPRVFFRFRPYGDYIFRRFLITSKEMSVSTKKKKKKFRRSHSL